MSDCSRPLAKLTRCVDTRSLLKHPLLPLNPSDGLERLVIGHGDECGKATSLSLLKWVFSLGISQAKNFDPWLYDRATVIFPDHLKASDDDQIKITGPSVIGTLLAILVHV